MSRPPSPATELKTTKRLLNDARRDLHALVIERNTWRQRAERLEGAVAEWKKRFDALLKILPASDGDNGGSSG